MPKKFLLINNKLKTKNTIIMKTKISLFTLVLVLSTTLTFAQYGEETRTSFGILAGVGLQNLNGKDMSGDKLDNKMVFAYHVGVNVQFPIAPQFYFQPGLTFGTKGGKNETGNTTSTYNIYYLELPLNLLSQYMTKILNS
jgi:hypothetical protein